jgi:hypothetical protein
MWHAEYKEMDKRSIEKRAMKMGYIDSSFISGKGSIGLTAICLAYTLGFSKFKLYGFDSSFDEYQHAYTQKQNEDDTTIEVNGYKTTQVLFNQVLTYIELKKLLLAEGCEIELCCKGLINDTDFSIIDKKESDNG